MLPQKAASICLAGIDDGALGMHELWAGHEWIIFIIEDFTGVDNDSHYKSHHL